MPSLITFRNCRELTARSLSRDSVGEDPKRSASRPTGPASKQLSSFMELHPQTTRKASPSPSTRWHWGQSRLRFMAFKPATTCGSIRLRGRDLGRTVRQAIEDVRQKVQLPAGYHLDWTGEYESQQRASRRLAFIVPITLLLMSFILYSAFGS